MLQTYIVVGQDGSLTKAVTTPHVTTCDVTFWEYTGQQGSLPKVVTAAAAVGLNRNSQVLAPCVLILICSSLVGFIFI